MLTLIARGVSLGFTAAMLPGPLQAYLMQTALTHGWRKAGVIAFTPLVIDAPIILLVVFVLSGFPPALIQVVQIIGGLFVLYLAWGAFTAYRVYADAVAATVDVNKPLRVIFGRSLLINVLSPGPYIFWATVNGPLLIEGLRQSIWHGIAFLVSFYGVFVGMLFAWSVVFDRLGKLNPHIRRGLLLVTAVVLLLFGISLLISGLGTLL